MTMREASRRSFLSGLAATAPLVLGGRLAAATSPSPGRVYTVQGPIDPAEMGTTLVHEHVLVDFVGADRVSRTRYDAEEVFRRVLPHLVEVRSRGCQTFIDCTPAYLGRDPRLLRRLSEASGLRILTNTGYYGAARDRYVPPQVAQETPRQLARRWSAEFEEGIEGTGIRPGFIKIGVDAGSLSDTDRKLVEAAALCHLETGLTIACHCDDGQGAREALATLERHGVAPEAFVWVHAQNEKDLASRNRAARAGAWVELDAVSPDGLEAHADGVVDLARRGSLGRTLVSHDAGWYDVGKPNGGTYRPHTLLFDAFVPALRARGLGDAEIRQLLVENPARAFTVGERRWREAGARP